jgi:hypothetical protein
MVSYDELWQRKSFYFRKAPFMPIYKMFTVTACNSVTHKEISHDIEIGWLVDIDGGSSTRLYLPRELILILVLSLDIHFR